MSEKAKRQLQKTTEHKVLVNKITPSEFDLLKKMVFQFGNSDHIMQKLGEDLLPSMRLGEVDPKAVSRSVPNLRKALAAYGLDTHIPLLETVQPEYHPLITEFSRQLIEDYSCKTSAEKALAQIVASAYIGILNSSRRLNELSLQNPISKLHIEFYSVLSKELDRANRHFIAALTTLKLIKCPPIELNVTAKTAYVSQNQQINTSNQDTNLSSNKPSDEIIDWQ